MMTVSVITPAYNAEKYIMSAIESVMSQTLKPLEMIIVDDCSTDNTWSILKAAEIKFQCLKVFRNKRNMGPAFSRNIGIRRAKGEYISFLDADDLWLPKKLETQLLRMKADQSDFCYSEYEVINSDNSSTGLKIIGSDGLTFRKLLFGCPIGCLTVVYKKNSFPPVYMPRIARGQDYGLWLKLFRHGPKVSYVKKTLALYRKSPNSVSSAKRKKIFNMFDLFYHHLSINVFMSALYVLSHIVHSGLKTLGFAYTKRL